ncbi:MAG: ATP-binding protein [Bacillota bacterium]|nr:ATP-binding protein [Bacillota bacterium]NLL25843.1 tRNA 2-thiocytidine(32) synthetase TtcA [Erysipelotrichia bacterium]
MSNIKKVLGCLRKADNDYNLISDGDKICVGISGGKDSSVLLYCLFLYQKFSQKRYQLIPIYCDMGFGENNIDELIEYFRKLNIEIIKYPTEIKDILQLHLTKDGKYECSLCSKLRKGAIVEAAKNYGCNKLAFGHHSDDAVETLFMNMIHGGRLATFLPDMYLSRMDINLIRPLIYAYESDISKTVNDLKIPIVNSGCSNDGNTERDNIKNLLENIYDIYKCKENFQLMLRNYKKVQIFKPEEKESID